MRKSTKSKPRSTQEPSKEDDPNILSDLNQEAPLPEQPEENAVSDQPELALSVGAIEVNDPGPTPQEDQVRLAPTLKRTTIEEYLKNNPKTLKRIIGSLSPNVSYSTKTQSSEDSDEESSLSDVLNDRPKLKKVKKAKKLVKLPDIKEFDGKSNNDAERFVADLVNIFSGDYERHLPDSQKVRHAARFLAGTARQWFQPHMMDPDQSPYYQDYDLFISDFKKLHCPNDRAQAALRKLKALSHRGNQRIQDYTTFFDRLLYDIGKPIDDVYSVFFYRCGLSKEIKDKMDNLEPTGAKTLIDARRLALQAETLIHEAKKNDPILTRPSTGGKTLPKASRYCTYCSRTGHLAEDCYTKTREEKKLLEAKEVLKRLGPKVSHSESEDAPRKHSNIKWVIETGKMMATKVKDDRSIELQVELTALNQPIPLRALIDSGASAIFIDSEVARKLKLPLKPVAEPTLLELADGSERIIYYCLEDIQLKVGNHFERTRILVTEIPGWDIVMGCDWLTKHDPQISWGRKSIQFNSDYCKAHCLIVAPKPTGPSDNSSMSMGKSTVTTLTHRTPNEQPKSRWRSCSPRTRCSVCLHNYLKRRTATQRRVRRRFESRKL